MMTLANYGFGRHKDVNLPKFLSKSLQIRNRAELALKQSLKTHYRVSPDRRNEIIYSVTEYYSRLPFNVVIWNKYQSKQCLNDSLFSNPKFNPYKAKEAFRIIEEMLINLVYLPWHQEFRRIYTYSGYYKLHIDEPLIGAERILKAAGFQESSTCALHLVLPDDKMPQVDDGECVTGIIFDCMMAQVICSDIIDVFENLCKAAKLQVSEYSSFVNSYPWIQGYFRERTDQTSERACQIVHDLLNGLTNHLIKLDVKAIERSKSIDQANPGLCRDVIFNQKTSMGSRESLKMNSQLRTRESSSNQVTGDVVSMMDDLLRIPTSKTDSSGKRRLLDQNQSSSSRLVQNRPSSQDQTLISSMHSNGFNVNQFNRQSAYDFTDNLHRYGNESPGHRSVEIDTPLSDREPLIPRYDRRPASHHNHILNHRKGNTHATDTFVGHSANKSNAVGNFGNLSASRDHFRDSYIDYDRHHLKMTSHSQPPSEDQYRGLVSARYSSNPSQRKYESRDTAIDNNILASNRTYWSCGSCTYNNLFSSDICEVCRGSRPSR